MKRVRLNADMEKNPAVATKSPSVAMGKRKTAAVSTSPSSTEAPNSTKALILTMALDTEMERALEQVFDSYRVVVPVFLPKRESKGWNPSWMVGEFQFIREERSEVRRFKAHWTRVTEQGEALQRKFAVEGSGPLLIKLFGSPLANFGPQGMSASEGGEHGGQMEIRPRMVLDERELLRLLKSSLPTEIDGLPEKCAASRLFFFGQKTVKWSDRIPFLIVDALRDGAPVPNATAEWAMFVALAERSEHGDSLFERLKVDHNVDAVNLFAQEIMEHLVSEGIEGGLR